MATPHPNTRFDEMHPAQQAGILCADQMFQRFASEKCGTPHQIGPSATAEFVRLNCGVNSRRDLNTNPAARARFDALRTDFDAWRGKIPTQR